MSGTSKYTRLQQVGVAATKYVLRIQPVTDFPDADALDEDGIQGYALCEQPSLDHLARKLSVYLRADVITDAALYTPDLTNLPPASKGSY